MLMYTYTASSKCAETKATAKTAPTSANIAFHIDYRTLIAKAEHYGERNCHNL